MNHNEDDKQRDINCKEICSLIFEVINEIPCTLLSQSKIRKLVLETVQYVREKLLSKFHILFENQLTLSDTSNNKIGSELWIEFISSARDLLLAYSLVSMLPVSM